MSYQLLTWTSHHLFLIMWPLSYLHVIIPIQVDLCTCAAHPRHRHTCHVTAPSPHATPSPPLPLSLPLSLSKAPHSPPTRTPPIYVAMEEKLELGWEDLREESVCLCLFLTFSQLPRRRETKPKPHWAWAQIRWAGTFWADSDTLEEMSCMLLIVQVPIGIVPIIVNAIEPRGPQLQTTI